MPAPPPTRASITPCSFSRLFLPCLCFFHALSPTPDVFSLRAGRSLPQPDLQLCGPLWSAQPQISPLRPLESAAWGRWKLQQRRSMNRIVDWKLPAPSSSLSTESRKRASESCCPFRLQRRVGVSPTLLGSTKPLCFLRWCSTFVIGVSLPLTMGSDTGTIHDVLLRGQFSAISVEKVRSFIIILEEGEGEWN